MPEAEETKRISRRKVLKYLGVGAAAGAATYLGGRRLSETEEGLRTQLALDVARLERERAARLAVPASYSLWFDGTKAHGEALFSGGVDIASDADTAKVINAASNALPAGGKIFLRMANHPALSKISIENPNIILEGEGYGTTITKGYAGTLMEITKPGFGLRNLLFDGAYDTLGGRGIHINPNNSAGFEQGFVENVRIKNCNLNPLELVNVNIAWVRGLQVINWSSGNRGLMINGCTDLYLDGIDVGGGLGTAEGIVIVDSGAIYGRAIHSFQNGASGIIIDNPVGHVEIDGFVSSNNGAGLRINNLQTAGSFLQLSNGFLESNTSDFSWSGTPSALLGRFRGIRNLSSISTIPFVNSNNSIIPIGPAGTPSGGQANPSASTNYTVGIFDVIINSTGGTGVSITIKDANGTTVESGLTTLTNKFLPWGWQINWGEFSVAPTVSVFPIMG